MPIHEKSLIRPESLKTHDNLVIDGFQVEWVADGSAFTCAISVVIARSTGGRN